jgi:hypothetical protein
LGKNFFLYYNMYYSLRRDTVGGGGGLAVQAYLPLTQKAVYQRQGMVWQGLPQDPVKAAPGVVGAGF